MKERMEKPFLFSCFEICFRLLLGGVSDWSRKILKAELERMKNVKEREKKEL